jgi:hypothetical protein
MRSPLLALLAMLPALLAACSSVTEGTSQTLTFESDPAGAECELRRGGMVLGRTTTPGAVLVQKTRADIEVTCRKDGYQDSVVMVPFDMAASTFGNVLIGGGIGLIVDAASGASIKYNPVTTVTLTPKTDMVAAAPAAVAAASNPTLASQAPARLDSAALWKLSEPALKKHFEVNREAYGAVFSARSGNDITLHRFTLLQEHPLDGENVYSLSVRFVGEGTRQGFFNVGFAKDIEYKVQQQRDVVSVLDWQVRN